MKLLVKSLDAFQKNPFSGKRDCAAPPPATRRGGAHGPAPSRNIRTGAGPFLIRRAAVGFAEQVVCNSFILAPCDFGHAFRWYHLHEIYRCAGCPSGAAPKEGAMTERDLTRREDRLIGLCLAATAIIVVFISILSTA